MIKRCEVKRNIAYSKKFNFIQFAVLAPAITRYRITIFVSFVEGIMFGLKHDLANKFLW